jgi:hypothetical protein
MIAGPIDILPVFFLGGDRCVAERQVSTPLQIASLSCPCHDGSSAA